MPRNNTKAAKLRNERVPNITKATVGATPAPVQTPGIIIKKTFEEALVAGRDSIASFAQDFLDVEMYDKQADAFDESIEASEITISAANRTGKSFGAGVWLIWKAFYQHIPARTRPERLSKRNPYKVFSTSLSQDQANLAWNYALSFTETPKFSPYVVDVVRSPFPELTIKTKVNGTWEHSLIGARSLSKGANYILGHSLAAVLVDECAFVPGYEQIEELVLRMRLADWGGVILRISSPYGKANHLYRYYLRGQPNANGVRDPRYYSTTLSTYDNPYIPRAFLDEMRASMSAELFAQNVLGQFIDLNDFFPAAVVQALYDEVNYPLGTHSETGIYVLGADLGAQRDATVVTVLDVSVKPHRLAYLGELRNASWASVEAFIGAAIERYNPIFSLLDETGVGRPTVEAIQAKYGNVEGFVFSAVSKPDILTRLQDAAQRRRFIFPFRAETRTLIDQLSVYRLDDRNLDTDYVMSLALAVRAVELQGQRGRLDTEIDDDLLVVPVYGGGRGIPRDLLLREGGGGGLVFGLDPDTGLFIPMGQEDVDGLVF